MSEPMSSAEVMLGNGLHVPIRPEWVVPILQKLRSDDKPEHEQDFRVDWAGIRTRITMLPWAPSEHDKRSTACANRRLPLRG